MDILADKYIMSLYQDMEDEVIADIARRVKSTGRYTETAELMAKSMHELGYSPAKIQAEVMKQLRADKAYQMAVAENTKAYKKEIQDIINRTVEDAKKAGDTLIAEAGNMAWNNDLSMWQEHGVDLKKPNTMNQLINAFRLQTSGQLRNLTRTMGFKNTVFGTTGILNAYQREMDLALLKVATGTFSFDQAVNDCIHRLAQSGLRSIDYANGRSYQLDTAARMSVRTGMSQLAGKISEENLKSTGQDLVITSQHMGSRPEHAPWQNKVFSYSGKSKKYPDFFKETGYGTPAGLKGVNCTHDFYPFWEGISIIPEDIKEPDPVTIDGKEYTYYQATQKQRQMERNIRATKREMEAQNRIGGPTTELRSKLKAQTNEYKRFSNKAGLKVRDNRLRVEKGTSELVKKKNVRQGVPKMKSDIVQELKDKGVFVDIEEAGKYKEEALENLTHLNRLMDEYKSTTVSFSVRKTMAGIENGSAYMMNGRTSITVKASSFKKIKATDSLHLEDKQHLGMTYHEFAHSLSQSREKIDQGFWREIRQIKKEYEGNRGNSNWFDVKISDYASKDVDEFLAEAFAQAKLSDNPSIYANKVIAVVDKYFKKTALETSDRDDVIKLDLQFFAKKHKRKKVPDSDPLWDSLVKGDIEQQMQDEIFEWEHGGYDYLIEFVDKYSYNILDKKKKPNIHE